MGVTIELSAQRRDFSTDQGGGKGLLGEASSMPPPVALTLSISLRKVPAQTGLDVPASGALTGRTLPGVH
jgi:hypothetical protein